MLMPRNDLRGEKDAKMLGRGLLTRVAPPTRVASKTFRVKKAIQWLRFAEEGAG